MQCISSIFLFLCQASDILTDNIAVVYTVVGENIMFYKYIYINTKKKKKVSITFKVDTLKHEMRISLN